ncbi:hypothetical protein NBH08_28040, partial [Faecalicatena sp. BF-R-105]|nr:hypothetical protein [Faecalicatena sp. BF-R-105]
MTNARRKMLSDCIGRLEDAKERIESILEAETDVLENTPENLQGTDRYEIGENSCASARVNPKFCVNSIWGANRAKFIQGGSRGIRLPPCQQHNAGGVG